MGERARGRVSTRGSFALLMGATFLFYAFNNVETSAMPGFAVSLGGSALLASAQTSLFVVAAVLLRLVFGPMSDRRGPRFVMLVGALGFTVPCMLLPLCDALWQVLALRACQAVGLAAFHPCVALAASRLSEPDRLGRRLGYVRLASTLSLMVGPPLLFPLIERAGYPAFFGALCALGLAGFALLLPMGDGAAGPADDVGAGRAPGPANAPDAGRAEAPARPRAWLRGLGRPGWALLALPLVCAVGYSAVLNFGKLLVAQALPGVNDGLAFTFVSLGGLAGSVACGRLADRSGARPVVAGCLVALAAGAALFAAARGLGALAAAGALFGFGYFGATTVMTAALARACDEGVRGSALALQQSCLDVGLAAGSLLAGAAAQLGGSPTWAFVAVAAVVACCVPAWAALARGEAAPRG